MATKRKAGGGAGAAAQTERSFESGMDEVFKHASELVSLNAKAFADMFFLNVKRTYDEFQHESLESTRRNRTHVDKVVSDAQAFDNATRANILSQQNVATQAHQNADETANMVGKAGLRHTEQLANQHTAHRDLASDAAWEEVEEGAENVLTARGVTIDDTSLKAIGAAVAAAVVQALAGNKPSA